MKTAILLSLFLLWGQSAFARTLPEVLDLIFNKETPGIVKIEALEQFAAGVAASPIPFAARAHLEKDLFGALYQMMIFQDSP